MTFDRTTDNYAQCDIVSEPASIPVPVVLGTPSPAQRTTGGIILLPDKEVKFWRAQLHRKHYPSAVEFREVPEEEG